MSSTKPRFCSRLAPLVICTFIPSDIGITKAQRIFHTNVTMPRACLKKLSLSMQL